MNEFQIADVLTPVPSGHQRLLMRTPIAGGDGGSEVQKVEDGSCWDVEDSYAQTLVATGVAVVFDPAHVLANLMKSVGVTGVNLGANAMAGLRVALKNAKVTVHR